jgi:tetratricopeptide (TPR) repeat protein
MIEMRLLSSAVLLGLLLPGAPRFARADGARYRVPTEPPASHYSIDARVDPLKGVIEGRETITLHNRSTIPLEVLALDWEETTGGSLDVSVGGQALSLRGERPRSAGRSTVWLTLPNPIPPWERLALDVRFRRTWDVSGEEASFSTTNWHPRLWWDGLPHHDSYSVALDVPAAYALAASGRLDPGTGRFEAEGVRTFGIYLGRGMKAESRDADDVRVTALFTEKQAGAAAVCLDTAVDAVRFYRDWLGFYPYPFLTIVPGGSGGRWGGYPLATGIVAIHGLGTYVDGESPQHWQHITSHEVGHQYWGEWVLDSDSPEWLWIAMGIYADTEYMTARKLDPDRGVKWRQNYLQGVATYSETPLEVTPAEEERIHYDRNNVVVHSKGPALLSALEVVLGRTAFQRIYEDVARAYGGKRLGWRDLQRACEQETGESLAWFFEPWVRSSAYLCYTIEASESRPEGEGFRTELRVRRRGTMSLPVPVQAVFEDGEEQTARVDRTREVDVLTFRSRARLKEAVLDPERKLAMLEKPRPDISPEAAAALAWGWGRADSVKVYETIRSEAVDSAEVWYRLGTQLYEADRYAEALDCFERISRLEAPTETRFAARAWMGVLEDVRGNREAALGHYRESLRLAPGRPARRGPLAVEIDGKWVTERLAEPFTMESRLAIPPHPAAEDLVRLVEQLRWRHEGRNPLSDLREARRGSPFPGPSSGSSSPCCSSTAGLPRVDGLVRERRGCGRRLPSQALRRLDVERPPPRPPGSARGGARLLPQGPRARPGEAHAAQPVQHDDRSPLGGGPPAHALHLGSRVRQSIGPLARIIHEAALPPE